MKRKWVIIIISAVILLFVGFCVYQYVTLNNAKTDIYDRLPDGKFSMYWGKDAAAKDVASLKTEDLSDKNYKSTLYRHFNSVEVSMLSLSLKVVWAEWLTDEQVDEIGECFDSLFPEYAHLCKHVRAEKE